MLDLWQGLIIHLSDKLNYEIYMHRFYVLPFWVKYAGEMLKLSEIKIGIFQILWLCCLSVYEK